MSHAATLISFLGKGLNSNGYRPAAYDFGHGPPRQSSYFALALLEHARQYGPPIDTLVLLGTSGSMWDVFFLDHQQSDEALESLDTLSARVSAETVTQADIDAFTPALSLRLGVRVVARIISHARDLADQTTILQSMADALPGRRTPVLLDVTHGFRHLPMLGLVATRFLAFVADARVTEIFYGALEMTPLDANRKPTGPTPVLRLGGLERLLSAVEAIATYDKDGDYSVFAEILDEAGLEPGISKALREAAFHERISNPRAARSSLVTVRDSMEKWDGPLLAFLRPLLRERLAWIQGNSRFDWELALGDRYLERRDFLRAATYWQEGLVTRHVSKNLGQPDDFSDREQARQTIRDSEDFRRLTELRNAMAHGVRHYERPSVVQRWVAAALGNEDRLATHMRELRKRLN